jgi:hypothetical protein
MTPLVAQTGNRRLAATLLIAAALLAYPLWRAASGSPDPAAGPAVVTQPRVGPAPAPKPNARAGTLIKSGSDEPAPATNGSDAVTGLPALPPDLALALAQPASEAREHAVEMAIEAWATVDPDAAATWVRHQAEIPRPGAMAALLRGTAWADADKAVLLAAELRRVDPENAAEYGNFLVHALGEAGRYELAAKWAAASAETNGEMIDWLTAAYARWAAVRPEAALLDAVALADPARRRAGAEAAIGSWARVQPQALADCAVNFPPGPEKNLAIVTALRTWAASEPEKVSEWMLAHRDAIASIPDLATINED